MKARQTRYHLWTKLFTLLYSSVREKSREVLLAIGGFILLSIAIPLLLSLVANSLFSWWARLGEAEKMEKSYMSFGFVRLKKASDDPTTVRVTVFVNAQKDFSGVRLKFSGANIEDLPKNELLNTRDANRDSPQAVFEAAEGSPQAVEVHFLNFKVNTPFVTCLTMLDPYARQKSKHAWVRQVFTPKPTQSGGIEFVEENAPTLKPDEPACDHLK